MAEYRQHGKNYYKFGIDDPAALEIGAAIGLQPEEIQLSGEPEFEAEAQGVDGITDGMVVGPFKQSMSMNGFVVDPDKLKNANGATFNFDGNYYIVKTVGDTAANRGFRKGTLTAVASQGIPDPTA
jgi:hypothetical protein